MTAVTRSALCLALLTTLLTLAAGTARADEADLTGSASTRDAAGTVTLVPIPDGVVLRRLLGRVTVDSSAGVVPTGRLELTIAGRRVRTFPARAETTLRTVVRRSDVDERGFLPVGLTWVGRCAPPGLTATLDDLRLVHGGTERVTTSPDEFFDDSVTRVDVVVPRNAGDGLLEAALDSVALLSRHYGPDVEVSMATADAVLPRVGAGQRVLRLQQGEPRPPLVEERFGLWTLVLQGSDGDVLAQSVRETLGSPTTEVRRRATHSLAELGAPRISLSGWGTSSAVVEVPQDVFGGVVDSYDLQLTGTRSAMPPGTTARLDVRVDDFLVDSVDLGQEQGTDLDLRMRVPAARLDATSDLEISLTSVPERGCAATAGALPVELDLDGTLSTLTADLAEPTGASFQQLPPALGGRVQVALRPTGDDRAAAAANAGVLVADLQRASGLALDVSLVRVNRLVTGTRPGVLIGATDTDTTALRAPVRMEAGGDIDVLGEDEPFAALQAVRHRGRDVLVLGSWAPAPGGAAGLARDLLTEALAEGWTGLQDNTLVQPAAGTPILLDVRPAPEASEEPEAETNVYAVYLLGAAGVMLLLLLLQVGLIIRKDRRVRSARATPEGSGAVR